jgi:signal transduction histidine kinase
MDEKGSLVFAQGHPGGAPTLREKAPVLVSGDTIGWIETETSLRPMLLRTTGAALLGLVLALAAYLSVHAIPLRALRRVLGQLESAHAGLERQVAETTQAYAELERHHREAEEAAEGLARALHKAEEAERLAAAANRTKSEFLANMSHELRTPLNAVIGFSDILLQELFGPLGHTRYLDYARDINECGSHLLQVVNEILDLSKIEASKLDLHLEPLDAARIVTTCGRLMSGRAHEAGLILALDLPANEHSLPPLRADETKVKQILLNLLSNAIKFTPDGGKVTMHASRDGEGYVLIRVSDTGIGMSEAEMAEAMKPFRQVDNSHTRKHQGTGLGLPLAKALTELHGGTFTIESEPEKGTSVTLRMPAETIPAGLEALEAPAA